MIRIAGVTARWTPFAVEELRELARRASRDTRDDVPVGASRTVTYAVAGDAVLGESNYTYAEVTRAQAIAVTGFGDRDARFRRSPCPSSAIAIRRFRRAGWSEFRPGVQVRKCPVRSVPDCCSSRSRTFIEDGTPRALSNDMRMVLMIGLIAGCRWDNVRCVQPVRQFSSHFGSQPVQVVRFGAPCMGPLASFSEELHRANR